MVAKQQCVACGKDSDLVRQFLPSSPVMCHDFHWPKMQEMAQRLGHRDERPPYRCTTWYMDILGPGEKDAIREAFHEKTRGWPMGGVSIEFDETTGWWLTKYWIDSSD